MEYSGEHLLPGQLGHFFVILSFTASLVAVFAYYKANNQLLQPGDKKSWLQFARYAFLTQTISIIAIFAALFHIIYYHYFEYKYAWQHSDKSLQIQYLLSCFWEGQEGSFMLWSFWHGVLGWILISRNKNWEAGVMTVICFAQFCLASMLLGFYFGDAKIGSSPFALLRNEGILDNAPIFKDFVSGNLRADYLTLLKDGQGLNVTLQNYWMVIHPPVLFLGFASTIVPFAFAIGGLWKNNHEWTKPALPWAAFSGAILGTGIMMGAAWAYESLNFGGYWAWDPVENASLVPWLVLVAGLHTNLVYQKTKYSLRTTYLFYILTFLLIVYSTFLTRSGILGDTSVHAFTDLGMNTQLLLFLLIFVVPSLTLLGYKYKSIPSIHKEENSYSREFWMFIGALVMCLSGVIIIAKTSVPVFNKIFGTKIAPPEDVEFAYNQIQIFIAIIIGIITATTQYLKYKNTEPTYFSKKIGIPTLVALLIALSISIFGDIHYDKKGIGFLAAIHVAIFASVYSIVANASYIFLVMKGKLRVAGASVAHIGFGMVLLGILLSSSKKAVLSWNTTGIAVFQKNKNEDPAENITLFKGMPTDMGKYMVTYVSDTFNTKERKRFFELDFADKQTKQTAFKLYPDVIKNNKGAEGMSANPANKHFWNKDIFVYVSSFQENNKSDTASFRKKELAVGDTVFYSNGLMILHKVLINPEEQKSHIQPNENALFLDIEVISKEGKRYKATPGIALLGQESLRMLPDTVKAQSLIVQFNKVKDDKHLEIGIKESSAITDLLTLKVYEFPMINVLWLGIVIMVIGFVMSILQRTRAALRIAD